MNANMQTDGPQTMAFIQMAGLPQHRPPATTDTVGKSIAEISRELKKMTAYQTTVIKDNQSLRQANTHLANELNHLNKQFKQLQLQLNNSQAEHETEMLNAHQAYKHSLEQTQKIPLQKTTYNPGHSNTFSMQPTGHTNTPHKMDYQQTIKPWGAATAQDTVNMVTGFPPPTRIGATVITEQQKLQVTELRMMLESTIAKGATEPTNWDIWSSGQSESGQSESGQPESGQSDSGQMNHQTQGYTSYSGGSYSSSSRSDSSNRSDKSTHAALVGTKNPKPRTRRSTSHRNSTTRQSAARRSRTRTPDPRRSERHPAALGPEFTNISKRDKDKSGSRRQHFYRGVQVTRLTKEEVEAQRPFIIPAKTRPNPEPPPSEAI